MKISLGEEMVAALILDGSSREFIKYAGVEVLLRGHEVESYTALKKHVAKYGALPKPETAEELGIQMAEVPEPPGFYHDKLRDRHIRFTLTQAVRDVNQNLRTQPREALDLFREAIFKLSQDSTPSQIVDFRDAVDIVVPRYLSRWQKGEDFGVQTGWKALDKMTGGIEGGHLVSFIGRPEQGKTQLLWWVAQNVHSRGGRVMFVSMEMKPEALVERGAMIHTQTPLDEICHLRDRGIPKEQFPDFKKKLRTLKGVAEPLYVVDGALSRTAGEVAMLCSQLKPDVLFVDGAYLLKHESEHLRKADRIGENCTRLKGIAIEMDIPVFATWQFNREGAKSNRKRGEQPGLEHIAGSDVIAQDSSLVLALMEEDSTQTHHRREIMIRKGRGGEGGSFEICWDWETGNFGDYVEGAVSDFGY